MRVVVIGAGVRGMAVAARLAKQGHRVTVCERGTELGGTLRRVGSGAFGWERGPVSVPLPAPLRDLFRKSGRPLERYVALDLCVPARRHVFTDGTVLDLPTGSRADQLRAIDDALGHGLGNAWSQFVDSQADVWNTLRLGMFVEPDTPGRLTDWEAARGLTPHLSLDRVVRRGLADARLRAMATSGFALVGQEARRLPAFAAAESYVERTFGVWAPAGGLAELGAALETRLGERSVEVRRGTAVGAITTSEGVANGVELVDGSRLQADLVIAAIDPLQVFTTLLSHPTAARGRKLFGPGATRSSPAVTYLGVRGAGPDLPREVVLHGEPTLLLRTGGVAPPGHRAWSVQHRLAPGREVLDVLAERGVDVRDQIVMRLDGEPAQVGETDSAGSLAWAGFRAHRRRVAAATPLPGLQVLGTAPTPLDSVPYAVWEASGLAVAVGKA